MAYMLDILCVTEVTVYGWHPLDAVVGTLLVRYPNRMGVVRVPCLCGSRMMRIGYLDAVNG